MSVSTALHLLKWESVDPVFFSVRPWKAHVWRLQLAGWMEKKNLCVCENVTVITSRGLHRSTIDYVIVLTIRSQFGGEFPIFIYNFIPGNDGLSESTLSKLGLADEVIAIQFLQLAAATRSIWCLFDMWTEVVIYLSANHVQKPQRVFDRNRSRPVLPHLGRSDVITLSLQRVKLKPLCGSSINLPCLLLSTEPWCRCLLSCIS